MNPSINSIASLVNNNNNNKNNSTYSITELSNPKNKLAARARNPRNPYGKFLYEVFPLNMNAMIYDRWNVEEPHAQIWAEGMGELYVATDTAQIQVCPLKVAEAKSMEAGQYYKQAMPKRESEQGWQYFASARDAPLNVGGFHKVVIDTKQPNTDWTLSARLVTTSISEMKFDGCAQFAAISRLDYNGFISSSDPSLDQCRNHLQVCETFRLESGKMLIRDAGDASEDYAKNFTGLKGLPRVVHTPMDGFFPILLHHDIHEKLDMIMIQCV